MRQLRRLDPPLWQQRKSLRLQRRIAERQRYFYFSLEKRFFLADRGTIGGEISNPLRIFREQPADAVQDSGNVLQTVSELIPRMNRHIDIIACSSAPSGDHAAATDSRLARDAILARMLPEIDIDLRL